MRQLCALFSQPAVCSIPGQIFKRNVNTRSPLATTFNTRPSSQVPGHFLREKVGLFGVPQLTHPEGFYAIKEHSVADSHKLVAECCSPHRRRKLVEVFDHLSDTLCRVADLAEFIRLSHPNSRYAFCAEDACISIGALVEKLNTDKQLYDSLHYVVAHGDRFPTDAVDDHVARLFLFDFEQSGIHLDDTKREKVAALNEHILTVGQHFLNGASQPKSIQKVKLPQSIRNQFPADGDNIMVTGLYSDSAMEIIREAAYKIYLHEDPYQEERLTDLVNSRHEMAQLCGFPSYAHRAIRGSLAESPELVNQFLTSLAEELTPRVKSDVEDMLRIKKLQYQHSLSVMPWDVTYLTGLSRKNRFDLNYSAVPSYFSLGVVMEGLNGLLFDLYGINLVAEQPGHGEIWHPDVYKVGVTHEQKGLLGHIYCDFYERQGKVPNDCHFTIRGGKEMPDGTYQNPVVVLHLNLPQPSRSSPCLLTHAMLENLFHEMGHAIHSMTARTKYQHVTGTRCCTDFAEVPSILMEFFAHDPRVLSRFASHYRTGEKMPQDLLFRMLASKSVYAATETQLQCFYALLDQRLHGSERWPSSKTTTDILKEVQCRYYQLPYVENTAWQHRFGHLVGYGAKYYAYLMSRAVASWIWQKCFKDDPFSRLMGTKLQEEVLCHGGGKTPKLMIGDFLGKEITSTSLVSSVIKDLDNKQKFIAESVICM